MFRAESVVTEAEDVNAEKDHIKQVLRDNGYKKWMFKTPKQQQKKQDDKQTQKTKLRQVDIPYIRGLSEKLQATFKKYNIRVVHKPSNTIRSTLLKTKGQNW